MLKILFAGLLLLTLQLCAKENLEVFATRLDSNTTHLHAQGDVVVLYKDHYLSAGEALYDREEQRLELFGHIVAMQGSNYFALGEYAEFDIDDMYRRFTPFYMSDKSTRVWMSTAQASADDQDFKLNAGMVSGCNPSAPLWKIYFSSSDYNAQTHWMNIYNARLHIYDVPIFYFPYFGYSLDTRRRSGLLTPGFGISNAEGLYYEQPFYIVLQDQWDLELRPQMRTFRGEGLYATLRFVESPVASGTFKTGYFQEKQEYAKQYDLANEKHYGFGLNYENRALLWDWFGWNLGGQSGLYSDVMWMTDVDYLNLTDNDETKNTTSKQIDSKINLFYSDDSDYFGTYFKYFLDLSKQNNDQTIQQLPTLHYHHFLDAFFDEAFYYNVDTTMVHFERLKGKTATQGDITLPLTLQSAFFDEYLDLKYEANFYGRYITFDGNEAVYNPYIEYRDGMYGRLYQHFGMGTSLTRGFEAYAHVIGFDVNYVKAEEDYKDGYYQDYETLCAGGSAWSTEVCDYYTLNDVKDATQIQMTQYLFNRGEQMLYHKLAQRVSYDSSDDRYGELENELELNFGFGLSYYSDLFYNHDLAKMTKSLNTIRFENEKLSLSLNHLYEDTVRSRDIIKNSYVTSSIAYQYSPKYRYFGKYSYDFEYAKKKNVELGFLYSKRCWDFGLKYVENNRPILTNNESSSVYDRYIYFSVALKPMGGTELNYKISNTLEGS